MTNEPTNLPATGREASPIEQMFAGLLEAVKDPAVDPAKAEAMLALQERLIDRQALMDFNRARHAAMMEMPYIDRDGRIKNKAGEVQSRFATFEAIDRIVRPITHRHGILYGFNPQDKQGGVLVTCELSHTGGHVQNYGPMFVPLDSSGAKNNAQGAGSSLSYGKRYTLCAALNIVTVGQDDDGQSAGPARDTEPAWTEEVLDQARRAATGGMDAYTKFFQALSPMRRGWLVECGEHDNLKTAAANHDNKGN